MADSKKSSEPDQAQCNCVTNPFADLPPELRSLSTSRLSKLRSVTCPSCGLKYWTNRSADLCQDCQKKESKP